jgi:hypothetical protein
LNFCREIQANFVAQILKIRNMKKLGIVLGVVLCVSMNSRAQIDSDAIGLRFSGGGFGSGAEISYQKNLGGNRLELDLGGYTRVNHGGFGLVGIYHWGWNLVDDLHWYVGPGAGVAFFNHRFLNDSYLALSVGGQIGLEYDFRNLGVPLQASLDFRPMWTLLGNTYGNGWSSGLGIRYLF